MLKRDEAELILMMAMRKFTKPQSFEFVCPFCGYRAKSLEELKQHILERHTLNREDIRGLKFIRI